MRIVVIALILLGCGACSFALAQALHLGFVGSMGLSFVISMVVLNVSGAMR